MPRLTVLHLAPHPDDEAIGAGATLIALRKAGHEVINLACSLGQPEDHKRRRAEAERASKRADFEFEVHEPQLAISHDDDLDLAQRMLVATLTDLIPERRVSLIVSPSPHDGHHGHEVVGRAARDALRRLELPPRWWMWGLWADLPFPTLVTLFDADLLAEVLAVLAEHEGELARNDYDLAVPARATVARVLGAEKAFSYGDKKLPGSYAELLTEAVPLQGRWYAAAGRILDASDPLGGAEPDRPLDWWLDAPSASQLMRDAARVPR
jgi:LmbE family N-acetylglucosaminyl deacetylase